MGNYSRLINGEFDRELYAQPIETEPSDVNMDAVAQDTCMADIVELEPRFKLARTLPRVAPLSPRNLKKDAANLRIYDRVDPDPVDRIKAVEIGHRVLVEASKTGWQFEADDFTRPDDDIVWIAQLVVAHERMAMKNTRDQKELELTFDRIIDGRYDPPSEKEQVK